MLRRPAGAVLQAHFYLRHAAFNAAGKPSHYADSNCAQPKKTAACLQLALLLTTVQASALPFNDVGAATTEVAASVNAGLIGPAPSDKAQIVFFRVSKFAGGAVGFKVREGETERGKLRSEEYFVALVQPGTHQYAVYAEKKDVLNIEVEAGETCYIQGGITMGILSGRPNLSPTDQTTFDGMAAKLDRAE